MDFSLDIDQLCTFNVMLTVSFGLSVVWYISLDIFKKFIYNSLEKKDWWHSNALSPTKSMMSNFGYPKCPTDKFPDGVTEEMARDFYAALIAICSSHFICALPMLPILVYGWESSPDSYKIMFILGTLGDVGFDIYDFAQNTVRCFKKGVALPIPIETWVIVCLMHHTTALALVIPMNLKYSHRFEYHQTAVSLLMAAAICYGVGCYKFAIDIGKKTSFYLYKLMVVFQLAIILYTRVYLWFPTASSFRSHLKEENDTAFLYGASVMIFIFSLFNMILVADGVKAVVKCLPKPFPKNKAEKEETKQTFRRASQGLDALGLGALAEVTGMMHRRKFKAAVHTVMAANRMSSSMDSDKGKSD